MPIWESHFLTASNYMLGLDKALFLFNTFAAVFFSLILQHHLKSQLIGETIKSTFYWTPLHIFWLANFIVDWIGLNIKTFRDDGASLTILLFGCILIALESYACILSLDTASYFPIYTLFLIIFLGIFYDFHYSKKTDMFSYKASAYVKLFLLILLLVSLFFPTVLAGKPIDFGGVFFIGIVFVVFKLLFFIFRYLSQSLNAQTATPQE